MKKEIIIVIIIVIVIIVADILAQKYTKNNFDKINLKLDEIREVGKYLNENKELANENIKKEELRNKLKEMQNEWKNINKKTAFYIEHDELEKVNASMVKFNTYFELEEYDEAIPELENCKYILNHIKEKEDMQFINLF